GRRSRRSGQGRLPRRPGATATGSSPGVDGRERAKSREQRTGILLRPIMLSVFVLPVAGDRHPLRTRTCGKGTAMAEPTHEQQALTYLREQLGADAPAALTEIGRFDVNPLEREG